MVVWGAHDPAPRWLAPSVGAAADVAVLERLEGMFDFVDNDEKRTDPQRLFPAAAVIGGKRTPSRARYDDASGRT
jgi:hypothetical protein